MVFDDIYLAGKTDVFRPQAWNPELLAHLRRAVAPGGVLAVNLVTGARPPDNAVAHAENLVRRVSRRCAACTTPAGMNEVLVAGDAVATGRQLDALQRCLPATGATGCFGTASRSGGFPDYFEPSTAGQPPFGRKFSGRHLQDCFIVIGSSGVTVRQELAKNARPRSGSSSRYFMGSIGCA